MKIKKIEYAREILAEQMNHWMLFPLVLTIMGLAGMHKPPLLLWELCSALPLLLFILRRRVKRFYVLVLLHMGSVGAVLGLNCINPSFQGGICVAAALVYALSSSRMQLRGRLHTEPIPLPVGVAVSAIAILIQHYQGTDGWDAYYTFALIGTVALFFIILYLQQYLDFLTLNQSSAGYLPAAEMFHSGLGLVLGYTLLGVAVLAASTHFTWLSALLRYVKDSILRFLRLLFSILFRDAPAKEPQLEEQIRGASEAVMPPEAETFWLWEVLWQIAGVVLLAVLVFAAVKLIIRLFIWLRDYFVTHGDKADVQKEDTLDIRERCSIEKNAKREKSAFFDAFSNRQRIRRLYKRKLVSVSVQLPERERERLSRDTAREWEEKLRTKGMAALYERARYCDCEVTGADVRKMKEACR